MYLSVTYYALERKQKKTEKTKNLVLIVVGLEL